jgi:hypothetical protein
LIFDAPVDILSRKLAKAYLETGRCAEAESIYRRLSNEHERFDAQIKAAVVCQTPTPTLTPWIPSQQVTATPSP